jgi:hypothetical protein
MTKSESPGIYIFAIELISASKSPLFLHCKQALRNGGNDRKHHDERHPAAAAPTGFIKRSGPAFRWIDDPLAENSDRADTPPGSEAKDALALAAALASHATGQGDICVNLRQWARRWQAITERGGVRSRPHSRCRP